MVGLRHRLRRGQQSESDPEAARAGLARFIEAANDLSEAWDPVLDRFSYPGYLPAFEAFVYALEVWRDEVDGVLDAEEYPVERVNLSDPAAALDWLTRLHKQFETAVGLGEDALRPLGLRHFAPGPARRVLLETRDRIIALLHSAAAGVGASIDDLAKGKQQKEVGHE